MHGQSQSGKLSVCWKGRVSQLSHYSFKFSAIGACQHSREKWCVYFLTDC